MTLAIKFGDFNDSASTNAGFIYIDAVTQYTRDFRGQVTSHPIASGGSISDHFIRNNPSFTFSGVISGADISVGRSAIVGQVERDSAGFYSSSPMNVFPDVEQVRIKSDPSLISLLPDSLSQFFVDAQSSVVVDPVNNRRDILTQIRTKLEDLFSKDGLSLVTLYEYTGVKLTKVIDSLVMTSLSFREDPDTGISLNIDVTLEKISFVELRNTQLNKSIVKELNATNVAKEVKPAATPEKPLGDVKIPPNLKAPEPPIKKDTDYNSLLKGIDKMLELSKTGT